MTMIRVYLDIYNNKKDLHPQGIMLGWLSDEEKDKFLKKLTSAKFLKQSCFSDIQYFLTSEYELHYNKNRKPKKVTTENHDLVIQAYLNKQKLSNCPTFSTCGLSCINNMMEATNIEKGYNACKNTPVANMFFNNVLIHSCKTK